MIISNLEVQNQCKLTYATSGILQTDSSGIISAIPGNTSGGTWTPAFTNQAGISALSSDSAFYLRVGNIINFGVSLAVTTTGLAPTFDISLPVNPSANFTGTDQITANGTSYSASLLSLGGDPLIRSLSGSMTLRVTFPSLAIGSWILRVNGFYAVT